MTTRLASLKASAELDATKYAAGAAKVDAANKKMAGSQAATNTAMAQTQARTAESARAFDKYRGSLEPAFRAQQNLEAGSRRLQAALAKGQITAAEHARLMGSLQQRYGGVGSEAARLQSSVGGLTGAFGNLRGVLAGVGVLFAAREYIQLADTMTNVKSKLRLVTESESELATVQKKLFDQANETRSSFEATVTLYARVARNADQLGLSQQKVLSLTETVNKAIRISGASSAEAASSVIQFSQALASGVFAGDEFKSLGENATRVASAIADGLGLTIGQLRALSKEGKLTADLAIKGLLNQKDVINREFSKMPATVGESFTVLNNSILSFVDKVDTATGKSHDLGGAIRELADVLNDPSTIAAGITAVQELSNAFGTMAGIVTGVFGAVSDLYKLIPQAPTIPGLKEAEDLLGELKAFGVQLRGDVPGNVLDAMGLGGVGNVVRGRSSKTADDYRVQQTAHHIRDFEPDASSTAAAAATAAKLKAAEEAAAKARERDAKAAEKIQDAKDKHLDVYLSDLRQESVLAGLTTDARREEEAVLRAMATVNRFLLADEEAKVRAAVQLTIVQEKQAEAVDEANRKAQEFNDDVTGGLADAFSRVFEGGKDGFRSLIEDWKRRFFEFLADMAAKALINPIIMPVLQSAGLGLGALGSSTGGLGANFGTTGVGGVSSLGQSLGSLGVSIDKLGTSLGLQGTAIDPRTGAAIAGQGLFGTSTGLADVAGGALGGLGIGASVGALTGGNQLGSSIGGLVGGALGSFLGPIGTLVGGAIGGFLGGLFGPHPTHQAYLKYDDKGNALTPFGSKATSETLGAVSSAAAQIKGGIDALEAAGATLTDHLKQLSIGERALSSAVFSSGKQVTSAAGDPNALALATVQALAKSANYSDANVASVLKNNSFSSIDELTKAVDFTKNVYSAIAEARPALSQTEQAMKDLTDGLKAARKEADRLGLSLDKFDVGAKATFNRDVGDQIKQILDPVGAALDEFERGAKARVEVAKQLGADLVQVERLNGLQRAAVLAQAQSVSVDGLKSLIDDISFGGLSAAAPDQQYFSVLTRFNQARSAALDTRTPDAINEFESVSRSLLPIARSFLGTSTNYANLQSTVVATARELGGTASDPAAIGAAIVAATSNGSAQIVDALQTMQRQIDDLIAENKRLNATLTATLNRAA